MTRGQIRAYETLATHAHPLTSDMQRFDHEERHFHVVPDEEEFVRLVSKLAADAAQREENRRLEELRRRQSERLRARLSDPGDALYIISIAAKLAEMHPQTLRKYDREGLVRPSRTQGSRRLYSEEDLERLQIVRRLTEDFGLNLNAVSLILRLVAQMKDMLQVLDSIPSHEQSHAAKVVAAQIRVIIRNLGAEDEQTRR